MIQPGVYFTLDAPLVSIIGLYSNCGESLGWLDEPQTSFLYNELVRLKKLQEIRRRNQQARNQIVQDLRRLADSRAGAPRDENAIRERLRALRELDERAAALMASASSAGPTSFRR